MRIALFHNLPSGGGKRAVYEWTRRLATAHSVDAYVLSTADRVFCDIGPLVGTHEEYAFVPSPLFHSPFGRLNPLQRWRDLNRLTRVGRRVARDIDARGYDVVLANTCQFTVIPAFLRFVECPAVYYLHEPLVRASAECSGRVTRRASALRDGLDRVDPVRRMYRRRLDRFQRETLGRPTLLLANSRFTGRRMTDEYGVATSPCRLGVDASVFEPTPGTTREKHVLSVGELSPRKGFDFLIAALGLLPPGQRPPLRIVSNSEVPGEREYLTRLADDRGVDVEIRMRPGRTELVGEYNRAALCVYAPYDEPLGLVALEAMACGTPVVGVCEAGVAETVVHEKTGILVGRDPAAFAAAVVSLLASPALVSEYGTNGRAHVLANWTWERSVSELEGYLAAASRRCPPPSDPLGTSARRHA